MSNDTRASLAPVLAAERYEFLDVLRGAALLGIVTANTYLYSLYGHLSDAAKAALPTAAADGPVEFIELWLVEFNFYTLFSLLFGFGFSILLSRAGAKGIEFRGFFVRRASWKTASATATGSCVKGGTKTTSTMSTVGSWRRRRSDSR